MNKEIEKLMAIKEKTKDETFKAILDKKIKLLRKNERVNK